MIKEEVKEIVKNYTQEELDSIKEVFSVQSYSGQEEDMIKFVKKELDKIDGVSYTQDEVGNILVIKGTLDEGEYYPCLVAHMDTVHSVSDTYRVVEGLTEGNELCLFATVEDVEVEFKFRKFYKELVKNPNISVDELETKYPKDNADLWEYLCQLESDGILELNKELEINMLKEFPTSVVEAGGCGDNQAGCWVILDLLPKLDKCKAVFTISEEIGCIGAKALDLNFLKDCGYMIEGDRKNSGDIIHDKMCSAEFLNILTKEGEEYGYKKAIGLFTDVTRLVERGAGISAVNLSVGYYDAHTDGEFTVVNELINARDYIHHLVNTLGNKQYVYNYVRPSYNYGKSYGKGNYGRGRYGSYYDPYDDFDSYTEHFDVPCIKDEQLGCCELHGLDLASDVIDADCAICNPELSVHSNIYCEDCATELIDREYSYYCPVCGKHKIKL